MKDKDSRRIMNSPIAKEYLEGQLAGLISNIVDIVTQECETNQKELLRWKSEKDSLDKMARIAELKIQSRQIEKIRKAMFIVLKKSTNKLVVATINVSEN